MYLRSNILTLIYLVLLLFVPSCQQKDVVDRVSKIRTDKQGVPMAFVPEGDFVMGTDDDNKFFHDAYPAHIVTLKSYYIDIYEITNAQYQECVDDGACAELKRDKSKLPYLYAIWNKYNTSPVTYLNWDDAQTYCEWRGARLPTEAEWEKAARGTDARIYPWGNELDCSYANYGFFSDDGSMCYDGKIMPVGSFEKGISPYGLYDMAGNVEEWVDDCYKEDKYSQSTSESTFQQNCTRILRGGSAYTGTFGLNSAARHPVFQSSKKYWAGARCAWSP